MTRGKRLVPGGQWPHTFQCSAFLWMMTHFLCPHSQTLYQKNVWRGILSKRPCGGIRCGNMSERSVAFSCGSCLRTWFSPVLPFRPFPQRTGTTVEGGREEEEVEGGNEGGLSHFKLRAIHLLFAFPSILFFHFPPLMIFCRHLEFEDWCWRSVGQSLTCKQCNC